MTVLRSLTCSNLSAGLAKPSPVIETFCMDELVSQHVKLDGVVTLVDSKHAMQHLNEVKPRFVVNEAVEQVAYADRIILNKVRFYIFLCLLHLLHSCFCCIYTIVYSYIFTSQIEGYSQSCAQKLY